MNSGQILVIGELVTDIIARVADPIAFASDTRATIDMQPGGAGGNVAAWLAELGADVTLIAGVGDDPLGHSMEADLRARGVTPRLVRRPRSASGAVLVLVDGDGERTMLTDAAASARLAPDDLPADCFEECRHLHISGYVLLDPRTEATALEALDRASRSGMTTSIDPASVALIKTFGRDRFLELTSSIDALLPAFDEGRELADSDDVDVITDRLAERYDEVALTLGADGATWARSDGERLRQRVDSRTPVTDLVGAGDAFVAGWLASGAAGGTPRERLEAGCAAGARAVQSLGAWPSRP